MCNTVPVYVCLICGLVFDCSEVDRASAFGSLDFGFDSELGRASDLRMGIHGFLV